MIRKKREKPLKLLKMEALFRRIPPGHPKMQDIERDKLRLSAGFKGEQLLDFHLSFLTREPFLMLHNLRLYDKIHYFQMDTLILHPSFFLVIEVKNFSGTLYFDPKFDQMIRTKNEIEEVFPDPVRQVTRQKAQLITWLKNHKCDPPPVESIVLIANPSVKLRSAPGSQDYMKKVIRETKLVDTVKNFSVKHRKIIFTASQLRKMATQLVRGDTPLDPDLLTQYGIAPSELLTGVRCPDCGSFAMEKRKFWWCPYCPCRSQDAHIDALRDYCLLVGPTITNHLARDFLHLSSPYMARNLLQSLCVPHKGSTKGRTYDLTKL